MAGDTLELEQTEPAYPGHRPVKLMLQGRCSPLRPVSWEGEQRNSVTWPDGSRRAQVRLAGPEERATAFRFRWYTRLMQERDAVVVDTSTGAETLIGTADELVALVQGMRRDPVLVDLTWRGLIVTGFIASARCSAGYEGEWDAELEFMPVATPDPLWDQEVAVSAPSAASVASQLAQALEAGLSAIEVFVTWQDAVVDDIQARIGDVRGLLGRIETDAAAVVNRGQSVDAMRKQVAAGYEQVFSATEAVRESIMPPGEFVQSDEADAQLLGACYLADNDRAARQVRHQAALHRRSFRAEGDVIVIHEGVAGDTIWSLSWRYYGTIAYAELIGQRNSLRSAEIVPGARIVIPRLSEAER